MLEYFELVKNLDLAKIINCGKEFFVYYRTHYDVNLLKGQRAKLFLTKDSMMEAANLIAKYIKSEVGAKRVFKEYDYRDDLRDDTDLPEFQAINPTKYPKTIEAEILSDFKKEKAKIPLVCGWIEFYNQKREYILVNVPDKSFDVMEIDTQKLDSLTQKLNEVGIIAQK